VLIRNQTRTLPVPPEVAGEPGKTITVRLLSGTQMDRAREIATQRQIAAARAMGAEFIASVQAARASAGDAKAAPSTVSDYDADTLVNAAFVDSSEGKPEGKETAADVLDTATRDWLAKEVEAMNVRPLTSAAASGA
jgi:hypothetical protein